MGFERGFKTRANRIAVDLRGKLGLAAHDPIDPLLLCELFDIPVQKLSELQKRGCDCAPLLGSKASVFSAVNIPCGGQRVIVHNDRHHPNRQRSNICHELAHCFLGHECTPPLTPTGERSLNGGVEAEANYLGGALLITNEAALRIVMTRMDPWAAQQLYGVSADMLEYRLRMSGAHIIGRRSRRS